jgi:hypothetical protein
VKALLYLTTMQPSYHALSNAGQQAGLCRRLERLELRGIGDVQW